VAAMDFSLPMIETARRRGGPPLDHPVLFLQGDALRIPFAEDSFDVVTMGYGLRNLADFAGGISEMFRVTRPGGRVLILDFGKPEWTPWRWAYFAYLRFVVPVFGFLFCGNARAYAYILESLRYYPAQRGVAELMTHRGFVKTRIVRFLGGVMTINYGEKPAADGPMWSSGKDR
jgi:demethylmenaquinone methyltransferase / 2-methoxy-6-polyprenyl-1,4-benzoquinol methylase